MVFLGVYYTSLDFGGVGAGGYTVTLKSVINKKKESLGIKTTDVIQYE